MSPAVIASISTAMLALVAQSALAADPQTTGSSESGLIQTGFTQRGGTATSSQTEPVTRDDIRSDALRDRARAAPGRTSTVVRQRSGSSTDSDSSTSGAHKGGVASAAATAGKRLDLRIPNITTILTPEQIQSILSKTFDSSIEEVEVEGQRSRIIPNTPDIPGGIAAPFWAVAHPTQAWRIFLPLAPDQARKVGNERFDITDPNLPPMLPPQM